MQSTSSVILFFLLSTFSIMGCQIERGQQEQETVSSKVEVTVNDFPYDSAPVGCTPQYLVDQATGLFDAIDTNDLDKALTYFSSDVQFPFLFSWNNTFDSENATFYRREQLEDLMNLLKERRVQEEKIALTSVRINGYESRRNVIHFAPIYALRRANDLPSSDDLWAVGKGAIYCETGTFAVLLLELTNDRHALK